MNDIAVMYMLWIPMMVGIALWWFYELNAFHVDRPERPRLRRALAVIYLILAWFPLFYVTVIH